MTRQETPGWTFVLLALVGAVAVVGAANVGLWWVAHQMAWWTYALLATAVSFLWQTAVATAKEARK